MIIKLLNNLQQFLRGAETVMIDTISMLIPWLSPVIPAYMAYRGAKVLGFP